MLNEISARINMNIKKYLPKVDQEFVHAKQFKTKIEAWIESKEDEFESGGPQGQYAILLQDMEFKINSCKAEVDHVKRNFSEEKLK